MLKLKEVNPSKGWINQESDADKTRSIKNSYIKKALLVFH